MSIAGGAGALLIGLVSLSLAACSATQPRPGTQPSPTPPSEAVPVEAGTPATARPAPAQGQQRARVSGSLVAQDGRQLLSGAVILISLDAAAPVVVPSEDVTIRPDGTFEFRNVAPGRYEVRARGITDLKGTALFAHARVTVDVSDLDNLTMRLAPGAILSGTIVVEKAQGTVPPAFEALLVRAPFADGTSFGDALTGQPEPGGAFSIRGLMPGNHVVRIEGLPDPWVLKSVMHHGQEIIDSGLDTEPRQRFIDLRVTITDVGTEVTGIVRDAVRHVGAGATVLVVPLSPQFWTSASRRLGVLRTDASGRFRIRGLPAGEYRVIAFASAADIDVFSRDLLRTVAATGVPLTLQSLESTVLDLELTPIEAASKPPREPVS